VVEPIARMLANNTLDPCNATARATDLSSLWHPYILLYTGHCLVAAIFALTSLYVPLATALVMFASGLTFVISAAAGFDGQDARIPIWGHEPGSYLWYGVLIKWLIVNLAAAVPVLLMRACKCKPKLANLIGIPVYVILGSNVIWTMFMDSEQMAIVYVNRVCGAMITIALILHCSAVCRAGYGLFEVRGGMPYGFGTSYAWILCYTVWNILFAARIGLGTTLQDFLFWALMAFYKWWDNHHLPVELYFGFARPVQLGSYIAFTEFVGAFIPYFYDAPTLKVEQPMPIYSNSYILFLAWMNMLWSFLVVFWSAQRLVYGLGHFQERFEAVHAFKTTSDSDADEMEALNDEEEEEEDDDADQRSGCVLS